MRFRLLGALEVEASDGTTVAIAAPKRRALLAALLIDADRPVSAGRLAEALWGSAQPPAAIASLHAHISRLRDEIGADRLVTLPAGYAVRLEDGELDVRSFEEHLADGRRAATAGRWQEAATSFRAASALWRGDALAEFAGDAFAEAEITRLEELRLAGLEDRIDADLALGRQGEITAELEVFVLQHPLRERLWRQLMLALYRAGRQADALAAYRRVRALLIDELGIDPSPELQELEVRILRQDPSLAGPAAGSTQPAIRLPLSLTSFVGRSTELDNAVGILRSYRLLTLVGPGGVGKTRLGILVARAMIGDHPDGVLFVDLAPVRSPDLVMARIGEAIGGERPAEVIGERRMLLVLDNFEQVLDAASQVAALLERCPNLRILVTSRAPLRIRGERQLPVPALAAVDAAALFEDRARAAALASQLTDDVVEDIVARLDGLPLAIELAAARIGVLSPESLRDRLAERLSLLTGGARDAPERHRTLRETIAWSYDLLDPRARSAFRKLSVFAPGFDMAAGIRVGETDLDAIGELVSHSLLRRLDDRYAMLETIHEFAAEQALAELETDAARDRHLDHFLAVAESTSRGTTAGGSMSGNEWIVMCGAERENLRVAFDWATARDEIDAIVRLYRRIGMYWLLVGAMDEGIRWGEIAIQAAARLGDEARRKTALMTLSEFHRFGGDPDRALELKREGLEIATSVGDDGDASTILDDMASTLARQGRFDAARDHLARALAIHERLPASADEERAHTYGTVVEVALLEDRIADAEAAMATVNRLEERMELFPDWILESECLRAKTAHAAGRDEEAAVRFRTVVRDAGDVGFRMPLVDALDGLSAIAAPVDASQGARLAGMADRIRAEAGVRPWNSAERERTTGATRAVLGDAAFTRLYAEGHALTMRAVVDVVTSATTGSVAGANPG
jgi:predicted ATPase/DNA-binding SARP family transcriptional activator